MEAYAIDGAALRGAAYMMMQVVLAVGAQLHDAAIQSTGDFDEVWIWHVASFAALQHHDRCWGQSGRNPDIAEST